MRIYVPMPAGFPIHLRKWSPTLLGVEPRSAGLTVLHRQARFFLRHQKKDVFSNRTIIIFMRAL
jgi:hypothetical protein